MAIYVVERAQSGSRQWNTRDSFAGSVEVEYAVIGIGDGGAPEEVTGTDAEAAVDAEVPATLEGYSRGPCKLEATDSSAVWYATVTFDKLDAQDQQKEQNQPKETGQSSFSFDTTGGSQHITHSLATVQRRGRSINGDPTTPSNWKQAIAVDLDGQPQGVDITVPVFAFQVTRYVANANMDGTYVDLLYKLTGSVNNAEKVINVDGVTLTFAAGELLFLGASGSKRTSADWELTLKFAASPNVQNLVIGDINGINKKGWEYLWIRYMPTVDPATGNLVTVPKEAHVEKVYELKDFTNLVPPATP